ncbi:MAG: hypothetical protein KCHDKBKB_02287 [Elusimicrobia bacterium]|nr:hypothetical protein [Elusimicrobiota bacterium]
MKDPLIPHEALEGLMQKVFEEQSVSPGLFWDALLNAHLVVPLAGGTPDESEKQLPLLLGVDPSGKKVIWIFTSQPTMVTYIEKDVRHLIMGSKELFRRLMGNPHDIVLIGPQGITLSLHPDFIASMAEGRVPEPPTEEIRHIPKDTRVSVGRPVDDASKLESKFKQLFVTLPGVLEGCFIQIADDSGSRLLLGLRLRDESQENFKRIAGLVAKASEGVLEKGKTMDITLINRSLKAAFDKYGTPFFKRSEE